MFFFYSKLNSCIKSQGTLALETFSTDSVFRFTVERSSSSQMDKSLLNVSAMFQPANIPKGFLEP